MHNDKHNGPVIVSRHRATITVALIAVIAAAWHLVQSAATAISLLGFNTGQTFAAEIPLQDEDLQSLMAGWNPGVEFAHSGSATVGAADVAPELLASFTTASVITAVIALTTCALVAWSAVAFFRGRLSWAALSFSVIIIGATTAIASFISQNLATTAAESLATALRGSTGSWMEPGFVSGVNFIPVIIGLAIAIFGWSLRGTGKLAEDAFGVV
ncbi:hypothetical protein JOF28_002124 [Leucobacter exalbidus]|uniref:Uncharacterized protein n=1 Tax=Leucobacter exalbidus TaxID=662960 RepID=A0A940PTZ7_9MICO|nr:hypothetical protein [Leucobacter exalbidus]MBP1326892.1 hypothetical protein [Leucobacter exalbidus]